MVELNVGGEVFATTIGTLTRNGSDRNYFHNMLLEPGFEPTLDRYPSTHAPHASRFSWLIRHARMRRRNGRYFIDRDGQLFRPILHYLRTGEWWCPASLPERLVLAEARFYCIEPTVYSSLSGISPQFILECNPPSTRARALIEVHCRQLAARPAGSGDRLATPGVPRTAL